MSDIGVVIAAASQRVAQPFLQLGDISLVQRLTLTYRKAGVKFVTVVTGFHDPDLKAALTGEGVVFIQLADYEDPELIESFRIGLDFLHDKCDRIFLTPVNAPMYTFATLQTMMASPGEIVIPSFRGRAGHPVLIDADVAQDIVEYDGPDGLAGLVRASTRDRRWVNVNDEGVLYSVKDVDALQRLMPASDESLIQPWCSLGIRKAHVIFDSRTLLLLQLIDDTGSVSGACRSMSLSLTRAWRLINDLEAETGFQFVVRSQGGHHGGRTRLTDAGRIFVEAYQRYSDDVTSSVRRGFRTFWDEVSPLMPPRSVPTDVPRGR